MLDLHQQLLLDLLASCEERFVHLGEPAELMLDLLTSLAQASLPALLSFIKFHRDLLEPALHLFYCLLILL